MLACLKVGTTSGWEAYDFGSHQNLYASLTWSSMAEACRSIEKL